MINFFAVSPTIKMKFCGIARKEDILECSKMGVEALGFLLGDSENGLFPDKLQKDQARYLISLVPKQTASVLLVKEEDPHKIKLLVDYISPDVIQIQNEHVQESQLKTIRNTLPDKDIVKTIRINPETNILNTINQIRSFSKYINAVLLDGIKGGSGKAIDWNVSKLITDECRLINLPVVLAGGLNPSNVQNAVDIVKPYMVDIMSGVSISRGVKDLDKISKILAILRAVNCD